MGYFTVDEAIPCPLTYVDVLVNWNNTDGKMISRVTWRDCMAINDAVTKGSLCTYTLQLQVLFILKSQQYRGGPFSIASVLEQKS